MSDHLDILEIYTAHVAIELDPTQQTHDIIVADAIQFACTFRNQIPGEELLRLVPLLGTHLARDGVVIQSYAASCLERILTVPGKISRPSLLPFFGSLFEALFAVSDRALLRASGNADSAPWENEYVMKAIMRLLVVGQEDVLPISTVVADKLCLCLGRVCANPRNPKFNHFLFEALAVLVRVACSRGRESDDATAHLERLLFPPRGHQGPMNPREMSRQ